MIKIERTPKPIELTDDIVNNLTIQFKNNRETPIWRKKYIQDALLKMSNNKCCFCEMKLLEEGKHLNIEHFHYKDEYPDEVVVWENLLPSCNRCNSNKGTHDTKKEPILNPTTDNPKDYLYIENYRYKSIDTNKDSLGMMTIGVLDLNHSVELVYPRYIIGNALQEKIEDLLQKAIDYFDNGFNTTTRKNRIVNGIKAILTEAQPNSEYSSTVATILLSDENYIKLRHYIINNNLWTQKMTELEMVATKIVLTK